MTDTGNWKKHLLASGAPLEHEVARILAQEGLFVRADHEFTRLDGGTEKEFSVDFAATWYEEYRDKLRFSIEMLIECKYRSRDKYILLFGDGNIQASEATLGHTLATLEELSPFHLYNVPIYKFERSVPFAYKAIEIHEKGAHEKDLRHAVQQLRYAAPGWLREHLESMISSSSEDRFPKLLTRILVTNSPLKLLNKGVGIPQIEAANSIEDITTTIPLAIMCSGIGPDFRAHYKRVFEGFMSDRTRERLSLLDSEVNQAGKKRLYIWDYPTEFVQDVATLNFPAHAYVTQIFVVTLEALQPLIYKLKELSSQAYRGKRKTGKWPDDPLDYVTHL